MYHLLKFNYYAEDYDVDVFLVLDHEQYHKFVEYGGPEKKFTYCFPICGGSDEADVENNCHLVSSQPLCDDNPELHKLLSHKEIREIVMEWLEKEAYYRVTFQKIYIHLGSCKKSCAASNDKYGDALDIVLNRSEYFKLKRVGKTKNFSLPNNHMLCDRGQEIFLVWRFVNASEIDGTRDIYGRCFSVDDGHPGLTAVVKLGLNE